MIRLQGLADWRSSRCAATSAPGIAQIIPTLLLVSVLVFGLQQLMPGDPALVLAGEERGDPQVLAQIRAELWLDRPLPVQYLHWIGNVLHGDLGFSWRIRQPVAQLIAAEAAGDAAARRHGVRHRGADRRAGRRARGGEAQHGSGTMSPTPIGLAGLSTPNFWLGIMLILLVSVRSRLAAAVGLCAADRGLAAVARHHHHAGLRAGQRDRRDPDAPHAQRHADGAGPGLRPHRARQGAAREPS